MHVINIMFLLCLINILGYTASTSCDEYTCRPEVRRFQEYVTINTVAGESLRPAVDFWRRLASRENVDIQVHEYVKNYPLIILKWPGLDSSLSSIMLAAHMDVMPAHYEDGWTNHPFSASINDQCEVVGRGTQEMKSGAIQYFEAMNRLTKSNVTLLRNVYVVITPDETSGSRNGMEVFVKTAEFQRMNVGFALDAGGPSPTSAVLLFHQDKTKWILRIDCYGQVTNNGILLRDEDTATGTCGSFFESYVQYRKTNYEKFLHTKNFGDFTAVNFLGGCNEVTLDINPAHLTMYLSVTLDRRTTIAKFNETVQEWARNTGGDIRLSTVYKQEKTYETKIDDSNPYWVAFKADFDEMDIPLVPVSSPTLSDANFIVSAGIPTFGMSPQRNMVLRGINERLSIPSFLEGICIYERVINRIANLPESEVGNDPRKYLNAPENLHIYQDLKKINVTILPTNFDHDSQSTRDQPILRDIVVHNALALPLLDRIDTQLNRRDIRQRDDNIKLTF